MPKGHIDYPVLRKDKNQLGGGVFQGLSAVKLGAADRRTEKCW
jgi:hypothetical protein